MIMNQNKRDGFDFYWEWERYLLRVLKPIKKKKHYIKAPNLTIMKKNNTLKNG